MSEHRDTIEELAALRRENSDLRAAVKVAQGLLPQLIGAGAVLDAPLGGYGSVRLGSFDPGDGLVFFVTVKPNYKGAHTQRRYEGKNWAEAWVTFTEALPDGEAGVRRMVEGEE